MPRGERVKVTAERKSVGSVLLSGRREVISES